MAQRLFGRLSCLRREQVDRIGNRPGQWPGLPVELSARLAVVHFPEHIREEYRVSAEQLVTATRHIEYPPGDPRDTMGPCAGHEFRQRLPGARHRHAEKRAVSNEFVRDDVAFPRSTMDLCELRRFSDIADVHGRLARVDDHLQLSGRNLPQCAVVRCRLVILQPVGVGDAQCDAGQTVFAATVQKPVLGVEPGADRIQSDSRQGKSCDRRGHVDVQTTQLAACDLPCPGLPDVAFGVMAIACDARPVGKGEAILHRPDPVGDVAGYCNFRAMDLVDGPRCRGGCAA